MNVSPVFLKKNKFVNAYDLPYIHNVVQSDLGGLLQAQGIGRQAQPLSVVTTASHICLLGRFINNKYLRNQASRRGGGTDYLKGRSHLKI